MRKECRGDRTERKLTIELLSQDQHTPSGREDKALVWTGGNKIGIKPPSNWKGLPVRVG